MDNMKCFMFMYIFTIVLSFSGYLCVEGSALSDVNVRPIVSKPKHLLFNDVWFQSAKQAKEYLLGNGIPEYEIHVTYNNWDLETTCPPSIRTADTSYRTSGPDDTTGAQDQRHRRSDDESNCQNQCSRSLCPWRNGFDYNENRTPKFIIYADCISSECSFNGFGLRLADLIRLDAHTRCEPIYNTVKVRVNGEDEDYTYVIACTCSRLPTIDLEGSWLDSVHISHDDRLIENINVWEVQNEQPIAMSDTYELSMLDDEWTNEDYTKPAEGLKKDTKIKEATGPQMEIRIDVVTDPYHSPSKPDKLPPEVEPVSSQNPDYKWQHGVQSKEDTGVKIADTENENFFRKNLAARAGYDMMEAFDDGEDVYATGEAKNHHIDDPHIFAGVDNGDVAKSRRQSSQREVSQRISDLLTYLRVRRLLTSGRWREKTHVNDGRKHKHGPHRHRSQKFSKVSKNKSYSEI